MMKKRNVMILFSATVALTLAACGSKEQSSSTSSTSGTTKYASEVTHDGTPIKGGTLKYAIVSSSPFSGIFADELSSDTNDSSIGGLIDESMFEYDENRKLTNTGLASIEFDVENKTATVTLNSKDYKWSDGQPVTIDDYIFAYQAIGNKDYTGVRYDDDYKNVVGMEEYHDGKADSVSGLEKVDDYTVKIHFKEMSPSMQLAGGSVCAYIMPKHIFKDIPEAEWEKSDYVRGTKFVGLGQFKIESIVAGESVTLVPNEHYYQRCSKS